jgi:hypothetical protein
LSFFYTVATSLQYPILDGTMHNGTIDKCITVPYTKANDERFPLTPGGDMPLRYDLQWRMSPFGRRQR